MEGLGRKVSTKGDMMEKYRNITGRMGRVVKRRSMRVTQRKTSVFGPFMNGSTLVDQCLRVLALNCLMSHETKKMSLDEQHYYTFRDRYTVTSPKRVADAKGGREIYQPFSLFIDYTHRLNMNSLYWTTMGDMYHKLLNELRSYYFFARGIQVSCDLHAYRCMSCKLCTKERNLHKLALHGVVELVCRNINKHHNNQSIVQSCNTDDCYCRETSANKVRELSYHTVQVKELKEQLF